MPRMDEKLPRSSRTTHPKKQRRRERAQDRLRAMDQSPMAVAIRESERGYPAKWDREFANLTERP